MAAPDRAIGALLAQHRRAYGRLRARAATRLDRGRLEEAAVYVQATADYAWRNHPGLFADASLEHLVLRLAGGLPQSYPPVRSEVSAQPQTVLHVLTQAYDVFGHTRLCWRWIEADHGRRHSVALTNQADHRIPQALREASKSTSGALVDLSGARLPLLERAAQLRAVAAVHDVIVLHVHPYDVVSAIAFARPGPAPVLSLNHADHVFWLGIQSADLFVHIRDAGSALAARRRGVAPGRSVVLPTPLAGPAHSDKLRGQTRYELGIGPDETMLLTVASAYKYEGCDRTGFLETVLPALVDAPHAKLVAAGPSDEGPWADARVRTNGRVLPLGIRKDLNALLEAADIYLDSFPLTSLTSVLEAGRAGLPLVRLTTPEEGLSLFDPGVPALDGQLINASNQPAFRQALRELIDDPVARHAVGARTRKAVEARHLGQGWLSALEEVYARGAAAVAAPRAEAPKAETCEVDALDLALTAINARSDADTAFFRLLGAHCCLLPPLAATRMWLVCLGAMREDLRRVSPARLRRAVERARVRRRARSVALAKAS